jgi:hypothetical protein
MSKQEQNLLCNFRAQTIEDFNSWEWYKEDCKKRGLTICRPIIALIRSYKKFVEGLESAKSERPELINAFPVLVQLKQQNTFVWTVEKPRRMPNMKSLSKYTKNTLGTTTTGYVDSYILEKARYLWRKGQRTWCFLDFRELKHSTFRKAIMRLKEADEIEPIEPRSCPRFYSIKHPLGTLEDQL